MTQQVTLMSTSRDQLNAEVREQWLRADSDACPQEQANLHMAQFPFMSYKHTTWDCA